MIDCRGRAINGNAWIHGSLVELRDRCFIVPEDETDVCNKCDSMDEICEFISEAIIEVIPETVRVGFEI